MARLCRPHERAPRCTEGFVPGGSNYAEMRRLQSFYYHRLGEPSYTTACIAQKLHRLNDNSVWGSMKRGCQATYFYTA